MAGPKVSICIPAYKQTGPLQKTLESIQMQGFEDYEIVLTDDSPDDAVEQLARSFSFGNKLRYFRNASRLGSPANWNEAVKQASGTYIKILHHDDWLTAPDSLATFVNLLDQNPDADFAFCSTSVFRSTEGSYHTHEPAPAQLDSLKKDPLILYFGNFIGAPSATIYRNKKGPVFDPLIKYVVDIDFYIRMLQMNNVFAFCSRTLICTTSESEEQVTAICQTKEVQLYEYTYLYNKLRKGLWPENRFRDYFYSIFKLFRIHSLSEFRKAGTSPPKPVWYFQWILLRKELSQLFKK